MASRDGGTAGIRPLRRRPPLQWDVDLLFREDLHEALAGRLQLALWHEDGARGRVDDETQSLDAGRRFLLAFVLTEVQFEGAEQPLDEAHHSLVHCLDYGSSRANGFVPCGFRNVLETPSTLRRVPKMETHAERPLR